MRAPRGTRARCGSNGWVLDGSKVFITNSGTPITSVVTVTARDEDGSISCYLVPADSPGLIIEPAYRKLGWHASDTHGITLHVLRGSPREQARRARSRIPQFLVHPRRRPHHDLRSRDRMCPCLSRRVRCNTPNNATPLGLRLVVTRRSPSSLRRGPGRGSRRRRRLDLQGGLAQRQRTTDHAGRRDRKALLDRGGGVGDEGRHSGLRRCRLHGGVSRGTLLPGRQGARDR